MSEENHTSAPWYVDDSGYKTRDNGICVRSGNWCVAVVATDNDKPRDANARLIAAAPEILAALKYCCDEASGFDSPRCYACRIENGHCAAKLNCNVWKAIAKAEGLK